MELDLYYNTVIELVKEAGKIVLEGFNGPKKVEQKKFAWDMVTEYDVRVEEMLVGGLSKAFPEHKFIAEETSPHNELTDIPTWLIDPIDGTTNFVHSCPHSCISVALTVAKKLVMGVVYNPMLGQMFTARAGQGAFLNGTRIHVSNTKEMEKALICSEVSMARAPRIRGLMLRRHELVVSKAQGVRSLGSAALSLCYVAMGAFDAYQVDFLYCWDVAAGAIIIREAGGTVLATDGEKFNVMGQRILTAGTDELAREFVDTLKLANQTENHING